MTVSLTERGIAPERLYPLPQALELMGWGAAALRQARKAGLRVLYYGRNGYIVGRDLIEFLEQHASTDR